MTTPPEWTNTTTPLHKLTPMPNNPRTLTPTQATHLRTSIEKYGLITPIITDTDGTIIGGHQRLRTLAIMGLPPDTPIPTRTPTRPLTPQERKEINIRLNANTGTWDTNTLETHWDTADLIQWGFPTDLITWDPPTAGIINTFDGPDGKRSRPGILQQDFLVPPTSVLDTRQGYWRARNQEWRDIITSSTATATRTAALSERLTAPDAMQFGGSSVSTWDPVLLEVLLHWYAPHQDSIILDPYAGGPTAGIVSTTLGHTWHGIELREDQWRHTHTTFQLHPNIHEANVWLGDSREAPHILGDAIPQGGYDLILTDPPFYTLENYSNDPRDLSAAQTLDDYLEELISTIQTCTTLLKDGRFLIIKISDVRDKTGTYQGIPHELVSIMSNMPDLAFHSDLILINHLGTGIIRARSQMQHRKPVRQHQHILIWYKGDPRHVRDTHPTITTREDDPASQGEGDE